MLNFSVALTKRNDTNHGKIARRKKRSKEKAC
jgi:hypothetical protein